MNAVLKPAQLPVWQGGALHCIKRIEETIDTASFVLTTHSPEQFSFLPGQFISIGVSIEGKKHYRAYSLSSSPQETDRLIITVKRVQGGLVSNYLLDHFKPGNQVDALAPAGEFHLPENALTRKHIMLSSGSGITPMMSMSRWLLTNNPASNIHFIHSARSESEFIFRDALLLMAQNHPNFTLDLFLTQPEGSDPCHLGRMTPERLSSLLPNADKADLYLCGHESYMRMVEDWHDVQDLPKARFHKESFAPIAFSAEEAGGEHFILSVPDFDKRIDIAAGQSLLDVMEAESLPILGACRSGVCGSCKCKVTSGDVQSVSTETLTPEEIESGVVLACSTTVHGDVSVELVIGQITS